MLLHKETLLKEMEVILRKLLIKIYKHKNKGDIVTGPTSWKTRKRIISSAFKSSVMWSINCARNGENLKEVVNPIFNVNEGQGKGHQCISNIENNEAFTPVCHLQALWNLDPMTCRGECEEGNFFKKILYIKYFFNMYVKI